ncbi:MAG: hypothetical protein QGF38_05265, partial [Rhodospirillales bacterium]|nr:hypothetical protein [Rhodospirillales bacterium]
LVPVVPYGLTTYMCHTDFVWIMTGNPPSCRTLHGPVEIADFFAEGMGTKFASTPCSGLYPVDFIGEGDRMVAVAKGRGELRNGVVYNNNNLFLFEVKQDKIVRMVECGDSSTVMVAVNGTHLEEGEPL